GFDIDVVFTPGHSPGHVTYAIEDEGALFSGDVLFRGSIGRTDLPGADHGTLIRSISGLLDRFDDDTVVHPGHMGITTLGRERAQAGRYRQFWHVGVDAIGSDDPAVDAETILLLHALLTELEVRDIHLRIGSLGTPASRAAYREELQSYLHANEDRLSEEVRE